MGPPRAPEPDDLIVGTLQKTSIGLSIPYAGKRRFRLRCSAWLPIQRLGSRHMPHWNDRYGIAFLALALGPSGAELGDWPIPDCLGGVWSGVLCCSRLIGRLWSFLAHWVLGSHYTCYNRLFSIKEHINIVFIYIYGSVLSDCVRYKVFNLRLFQIIYHGMEPHCPV
jgi:hypothetical protein